MVKRKTAAATLVKREVAAELHKPARRNYERRHTTVKGFKDLFQADIVEMQPYANKNSGYRYMLTVIDVFSKYAWAKPIKGKDAASVTKAMRDILDSQDGKFLKPPRYLQTDRGKEFYNATFQNMLKEYNIKLYSTYSVKKAAVIERFNRTLKEKMWREFSISGSYRWIDDDVLPNLLREYNNRVHRTTGMKPNAITVADESKLCDVYRKLKSKHVRGKVKFNVGDCVRISKLKGIFEKGYTANWSTELFTIDQVLPTSPVTYELRDFRGNKIEGCFYGQELQKAKHKDVYLVERIVKRKGNKVLVKWLGFPSSENTWENERNIV